MVIEKHGSRVTLTHYFEQDGDLISDPDMEFVIGAGGEWYPVALQLRTGHYFRARWFENGKEYINARRCTELKSFSTMWAKNLVAQGW